jgi:septum site-determining protein MinD
MILTFHDADGSGQQALFSVNTALSLALARKDKTALIDLCDPGMKEVESLLGAPPERAITDLLPLLDTLDSTMMASYLPQNRSGITVIGGMSGSSVPGGAPQQIIRILGKLSACFPFVIINAPHRQGELLQAVFEASDLIVLPVMPHLLSVHRTRSFLDLFQSWHFPLSMIKVLTARMPNTECLNGDTVAKLLNISVSAEIPFDAAAVVTSINNGSPAVIAAPHSDFALAIKTFAAAVTAGEHAGATEGTGDNSSTRNLDAAQLLSLKRIIHRELIDTLDIPSIRNSGVSGEQFSLAVRNRAREIIQASLAQRDARLTREERVRLIEELLDEALGLGCIEPLLKDPGITEIMINGPEHIYVEIKGKIEKSTAGFDSLTQLMTVVDRIVAPLGRRVDESSPLVDARLADGSRVNIIIPPLALNGPAVTIRKFAQKKLMADDLIAMGALSPAMAEFLSVCVRLRKNIIISGGTGSGKTTLLNVISSFIPSDERIVTIEDSAELQLPQEHVVRMESRPASIEGTGEIPIRRLVINALRMRPDRIVVGECRGGETLDMLQAMNTGHDGSLTTLHANSSKDALTRLTTMAMMAGMELSEQAIRDQITSAIHCIVQLNRFPDGTRKITEIAELIGTKIGAIETIPVFVYEQSSFTDGRVTGRHKPTGTVPQFMDGIEKHGLTLKKEIFSDGGNHAAPV